MADRSAEWQRRRARFSHDWLKNRFLLTVGSFLGSTSGEGYPVERTLPDLVEVMAQWRERRESLRCLLDEFESAMSPVTLFDFPPLKRLKPATRTWLEPLTHRLWWKGRKNEILVKEVWKACRRADEAYQRLDAVLKSMGAEPETEKLDQAARQLYSEFQRLAEAIHRLPSKVEVV